MLAVETGACPHTAIREDPTLNIQAVDEPGRNVSRSSTWCWSKPAATISPRPFRSISSTTGCSSSIRPAATTFRESAAWAFCGRDLLVINKIDLAPFVGANIDRMVDEANEVRRGRPVMLTNCKTGEGVEAVVDRLVEDVIFAA